MGSRTTKGKHTSANILLGISLSVLLIASVIPVTYAVEGDATTSFTRFDGNDYIDIGSSPNLQLLQFTLEARFRISQMPAEPEFIISKSAGTGGIFDKNYALFITKEGKVGGAFRADDGTEHAVYSDLMIVNSGWHTARVVYDGIKLKLKLDGITVDSKLVAKKPDAGGTTALRIGANAGGSPDNFFVGDLDYAKMLDRSTFKKVYFNDFGGSTPDPTPDPDPDPTPTPDPTSTGDDCDDTSMSKLRGAVFMDAVLGTRENGGSVNMPLNYVRDSMKFMKANGMNLVRVPFYWEAYVHDPVAFLNELELIAQAAEANDMCVIFDNHHWYTTSYWDLEIVGNSDGRGFPSFVVKNFANRNNDYEDTAGPFWTAFLSNSISVNGRSVWDVQADFFAKVIGRVDKYNSVTGYEILNEPHLFASSQYEKLGDYHTYMAKKIRSMTDKKIVFDRETARGFTREPSSEYKIVPRGVSGIVYGPHLYAVPSAGTQGDKQLANFAQWSKEWGMEILIGEWSAETSAETDTYLRAFEEHGFAWTYYAWKPTQSRGGGASLYDSPIVDPTEALRQLQSAISRIYG
jgi:hypothetical protein